MRLAPLAPCLLLAACAGRAPTVATPDGDVRYAWTEAERAQPIAVHRLRGGERTSAMLVRLRDAEQPHRHAAHDLLVVVLSGRVRVHLGARVIDALPGDVTEIPRGTPHWAENVASDASVVYVVSAPAYDAKDTVPE